ncbi:MAG: ABC transporter ATP-binding protein, partial [Desulfitobacterium sp.]|nr:ABC transporter ATP-binding protein [Desulfitobacterium sp.]
FAPLTDEEKQAKPEITLPFLKRILSYLLPYWPRLLLILIAIIISSILGVLPPLLSGRIIDDGLIGKDFPLLCQLISLSFIILVVSNSINVLEGYLASWVAQHIIYDMKNQMYDHLQHMSHRFFTDNYQGDIITRMTTDINGIQTVIVGTLTRIVSNSIILIVTLVALFQKNFLLALVSILMVPLFIIPTNKVGNRRWTLTLKKQEHTDAANQLFNETLSVSGQLLVKLFTREEREYKRFEKINRQITHLSIREMLVGKGFRVIFDTFTNMGPMIIYLVGGFLIIKMGSGLTVGDITVVVALLGRLYRPVDVLLTIQVDVIRSFALFSRIFDYFDMPIEVKNSPNALTPKVCHGEITFEKVSFDYGDKPILKDLDLTIKAGESIAIVGPSGTGKSTLINLIPRLFDVTKGRVLLDGRDLRDLDLKFLRQNIGMVPQDSYLFNGTIRENLLYANEEATEEDLIRACQEANIYEFISSLPDGFDSVVGNWGLKLSGGEKQRLSIARVLLKNPKILIMDEATSSLDSINESLIQEAIEPILKGRTSIVIAHRLSTVMAVDRIIVLQEGEIVQQGTHWELLEEDGVYKELYETQFKVALEDMEQLSSQNSF